jgi:hypothetical protein
LKQGVAAIRALTEGMMSMATRAGRTAKKTGTAGKVGGTGRRKNGRAAKTADGKPLSAATLRKLIELGNASDAVELKLSVPAPHHRATIRSLGLDPVEAQPRQAYFFDTPDLKLSKAGLVLRARRIQGGRADTVIKMRPVDPATVDPELRRSGSFKVELDVVPGGFVCSASFKGVCTGKEVLDMTAGKLPLRDLFSKEQRAFYKAHAPAGIKMKSLVTLGPTFLLRAKHIPKEFPRGITVEMWLYPDGSRILEISTKALPEEAFKAAGEFRAFLASAGVDVSGTQETKTRTMLEFYSRELAAHPPAK